MDDLTSALSNLGLKERQENEREKKKLVKLIKEKMENGQTCSGWLRGLHPIPIDEFKSILETYTKEFEDFAQRQEENESDLKYSAIEAVAKRCVLAHIHVILKNYEEVPPVISEAYKLIQYCINEKYFAQDYADGFCYVVHGLEIFCAVEKIDSSSERDGIGLVALQKYLQDLNTFSDLNQKNQVGVLAVKQYFIGCMSRVSHEEQLETIQEMIKMDPDNCEWHCCMYVTSRFCRESVDKFGPPSKEEKAAIETAINVPGAKFDPRILISQIMCLAGILKSELNEVIVAPLRFGNNVFYTTEEVISFIRSEADEILSIDPMSVRSNINIAKIFSSILPRDHRDNNFAKVCIKRALLFHPTSSKANHRMAVFYLLAKRDLPKALKYAKRAYEADKRNTYALMDLLGLYMEDINKNNAEINSTFDDALNSGYCEKMPPTMAQILFTNAIFNLLCGKPNETIELLLKAYTIDAKTTEHFEDIGRDVSRYKWYQNSQGKNIPTVIEQLLANAHRESTNPTRKSQLSNLWNAARNAEQKSRNFGRGGGRGGGTRGGFRADGGSRGAGYRGGFGDAGGSGGGFGDSGGNRGGFGDRGEPRGGGHSEGFLGSGHQGLGDSSGRGGFYRNTDVGYSRGNSYNNKDESQGGRKNLDWKNSSGKEDEGKWQPTVQHKPLEDDYAVLGIATTATKVEIRTAYRKLAMEHHPDKNSHLSEAGLLEKQEEMKKINMAWESIKQNSKSPVCIRSRLLSCVNVV